MRTVFFICFFSCCLYHTQGQTNNDIVIGKIDSLESETLKEQRKIWVHLPDGYDNGLFEKKTYPVVYLLDGDAHFYSVVGMIRQLSSINGNTILPKMIVVGIPNTNRTRDLTPTKQKPGHPFVDSTMVADSGGGENFIAFIEKELIPYIEAKYPTEPHRTFIGHSFGGLTVLNTLIKKPELFNAYISIDPSMWWDDQKLLEETKRTVFDERYHKKSLYLGIANTMSEGMDTTMAKSDTTFATEHIRSILALNAALRKKSGPALNYQSKFYGEDDHGSVPLITEYDALRFIFDFYKLKMEMDDYINPDSDFAAKVEKHYQRLSEEFGKEVKPDEEFINNFGYQFLSMQQFDKAEKFFKLNVRNYPQSFNAYDSLGDFYVAVGNKQKAMENFKKSIALNKDSMSKDKLQKLEME